MRRRHPPAFWVRPWISFSVCFSVSFNSSVFFLLLIINKQLSHDVTKRTMIRVFAVCMKKPWVLSYPLSTQRRLIRLGGFPGWSESSLGAHSFCWFCPVAAEFINTLAIIAWDNSTLIVCRNLCIPRNMLSLQKQFHDLSSDWINLMVKNISTHEKFTWKAYSGNQALGSIIKKDETLIELSLSFCYLPDEICPRKKNSHPPSLMLLRPEKNICVFPVSSREK